MASNAESRHTSRGFVFSLSALFLVLLLYVLSPGPLAKYYRGRGQQPSKAVEMFYAPLQWAYDHVPGAGKLYDWYFEVWSVDK